MSATRRRGSSREDRVACLARRELGRSRAQGREHGKGPCRWKVLWAAGGGRLHGWIARSSLGGGRLFSPRVSGPRTGVTAGKQASTTGAPEVTSLAGMRRSECGVVKRFILSRVERRRAQTRRGESCSLSKGGASDTPLETREMRVHVTAVTVGRHWSYSSWSSKQQPSAYAIGCSCTLLTGGAGEGLSPKEAWVAPWTVPARGETAKG
jgi:hypothetical protein